MHLIISLFSFFLLWQLQAVHASQFFIHGIILVRRFRAA